MDFLQRLKQSRPLIIDGAMGTMLFKKVEGYSGPFEMLNIERPEIIEEIHREYINSGADIIETNTFGASRLKLLEYGLEDRCEEINEKGAIVARKATKESGGYVAGSVAPTGMLVEPMGETPPELIYESYAAQVRGLARGGADIILIETINDIQEAKLALLAAKDNCDLPVTCSLTFEENGKTMTGTDMITGFATAMEYGACVVGANCSMGPEGLVRLFKERIDSLHSIGTPMSVWSNAGLPEFIDGESVYRLSPADFADTSVEFARMGLKIIGGCCGTTPDHIRALHDKIYSEEQEPLKGAERFSFITSRSSSIDVDSHNGLIVIGERLNPTARKKFAQDLKEEKQGFLREESRKQGDEGAHILDINVGVPSIDEIRAMHKSVTTLSGIVSTPLMIDSDNREVIEKALLTYPGVPVVNSINGKQKSIDTILPVLKRFGCFVVALCMDDTGIHREADKRIAIGENLLALLKKEGIQSRRVFIDPLMLAESAEPGSAAETLKVIKHFSDRGIKTSLGLSNISFGLPNRKFINRQYLRMAIEKGLTAAIVNPAAIMDLEEGCEEEKLAERFLTGEDPGASEYIKFFSTKTTETNKAEETAVKTGDIIEKIYACVVEGNSDEIEAITKEALLNKDPQDIMDNGLLAALEKVGELYSTGEYFLPQMISSANAMKKGFNVLKPILAQKSENKLGTVVICTVKGDVHDIGKNIVAMMLENHGFEVHDLGKDIDSELVIEKAREYKADIICLSSLLTTTMGEMQVVSRMIQEEKLNIKLMIGGAVVNQEYADSISASYSKDAVEGVNKAKELMAV